MNDKLDEAIAAAAGVADLTAQLETNATVPIVIASTGRPVALNLPADLTDDELLELVAYMTLGNRQGLRARLRAIAGDPASRLVVHRGPIRES